ncbi:spore germination protein [Paenibacillus sp. CGMCC 1.16610]|uniref:Spore germination protein n=1 Tax=Paenibacillus anseongense TaxID=2682845 RepID=A0ABW9UGP1_9BACL|nr:MULTISPECIES: spore germination protein [Paenibacillus]MBA2941981.1 spore germination protein [Paenibacillus sp. CGMCC 1.16610]MVQ38497.1 hypothetical protein [Paenibacillus anseongense]
MVRLQKQLEQIREALFHTEDLTIRSFEVEGQMAKLVFLETLCDEEKLQISLFKQWFRAKSNQYPDLELDQLLTAVDIKEVTAVDEAVKELLKGKGIIGLDSGRVWFAFNAGMDTIRSIQEPVNELSIVGERAGFVESMTTNLHLLRSRVSTGEFRVRYCSLGRQSTHRVAVVWIEEIADKEIVEETYQRISRFTTNREVHPGRLQRQLMESKYSIFPQIFGTERIDATAGLLMQGRIAVICDQSSTCLIVPASLYTFMQSVDAYLLGKGIALLLHSLRAIGMFLSLYACALYIAIVTFHHEVLPAKMSISIKSSLENVPYPPFIEAILMIVIFQLIAEATIRLPSQLAQMTGVAGGIIISESLVKIGFVSNVYIVIIALSMIGNFMIPTFQMRIFAFAGQMLLVFGSAILGFYGIAFVTIALLIHFFTLEPFGVPYCMPIRSRAK